VEKEILVIKHIEFERQANKILLNFSRLIAAKAAV
jgi:hypothetical protein